MIHLKMYRSEMYCVKNLGGEFLVTEGLTEISHSQISKFPGKIMDEDAKT